MEGIEIKPGPKAKYDFGSYEVGYEIKIEPLKQSSFKSMLSKFNGRFKVKDDRHRYSFTIIGKSVIARRVK